MSRFYFTLIAFLIVFQSFAQDQSPPSVISQGQFIKKTIPLRDWPTIDRASENDIKELRILIENHYNATMSPLAQHILENWEQCLPLFVKVLPEEYRQALIRLEQEKIEIA